MFLENSIHKAEKRGWIEVFSRSMFMGKTKELISRLKRAKIAGLDMDYRGRTFSPVPGIMETAQQIKRSAC